MCIQYTYIFILYSLHPDIPSISPYSIISPKQCQHSYHNTWPWGKSYSCPRPVQYPTAWLIDIFSEVQRRQDRQVHLNESKSNTRIYLGNPSSVTSFLYDSVRCRTYTGTPVSVQMTQPLAKFVWQKLAYWSVQTIWPFQMNTWKKCRTMFWRFLAHY